MKRRTFLWLAALTLGLVAFALWGAPYFFQPPIVTGSGATLGSQTERARVMEILSETPIQINGETQISQRLRVEVLGGQYAGLPMELDYGKTRVTPPDQLLRPGDEIFITLGKNTDGVLEAFYVDFVRQRALLILLGVFVAAILLMAGWKGFRALLALIFSLAVVVGYIIPHILTGEDPVTVSVIGSAILLGVSLYLTYGWMLKTHASVLSMILVLLLTGTLASVFMQIARLNGFGSEEALFLQQFSQVKINLRGLLLGGIIIGALGVLDDLVTTQSALVFELHHTDERLGFRALFGKAMRVGQDHVAATVNTLVLAYAGASLPLLLLFTLGGGNYDFLLNVEMISEEIVRTLVGSLGLMAAVPLTTAIAILLALYTPTGWRALLGPAGEAAHDH
ncbi:MAG: hypothetical protein Fur0035_18380 [Anaerolineales bacterium]